MQLITGLFYSSTTAVVSFLEKNTRSPDTLVHSLSFQNKELVYIAEILLRLKTKESRLRVFFSRKEITVEESSNQLTDSFLF